MNWILETIGANESKVQQPGPIVVCVMPDSQYVAGSALAYLARLKGVKIQATSCKIPHAEGYRLSYDDHQVASTSWFVLEDPPDVEAKPFLDQKDQVGFDNLVQLIKHSSQFKLIAVKKLPDARCLSLYRRSALANAQAPWPTDALKSDKTTLFSIDVIDGKTWNHTDRELALNTSEDLTFVGWAVDSIAHAPASRVGLCIDNGIILPAAYGSMRPDVAKGYEIPSYEKSGFQICVDCSKLGVGKHTAVLRILARDSRHFYEAEQFTLNVQEPWHFP